MAYEVPAYSRTKVDRAGTILRSSDSSEGEVAEAWHIITNWRSAHAFPLNTITMDLRQKVKRVNPDALVVQRLKRARSILSKLDKESSMRMSQMQDLGGCRAVVENLEHVYALRDQYLKSRSLHRRASEDDYIKNPRPSGYRGLHLVYQFESRAHPEYNHMLIEVQLRTVTQHAWATAVETVGAVIGQALKASQGEKDWLDYFRHAALALELYEEPIFERDLPISRGTIARKLQQLGRVLEVEKKLTAYREALKSTERISEGTPGYFLLVLLPEQPELQIYAFSKRNLDEAYREYERIEQSLPAYSDSSQLSLFPEFSDYSGAQAVLVGAESFRSIRASYPNYYLDTEIFLDRIRDFIKRYRRRR